MLGVKELFGREIIFEEFLPMYLNVTDGQTDNMQSHNRTLH